MDDKKNEEIAQMMGVSSKNSRVQNYVSPENTSKKSKGLFTGLCRQQAIMKYGHLNQ